MPGLRGIERGVVLSAQRFAGEPHHMIRDKSHAEYRFELAMAHGVARCQPELAAIIRENADSPHDIGGEHRRAPQIGKRKLGRGGGRRSTPSGGRPLAPEPMARTHGQNLWAYCGSVIYTLRHRRG